MYEKGLNSVSVRLIALTRIANYTTIERWVLGLFYGRMKETLIFGITAVLAVAAFIVFRGKRKNSFTTTMKVLVLFYVVLAFFRFLMADGFIWIINGGMYNGIYYENTDYLQSVLRWGHAMSYTVLAIAIFFDNRLLKNISIYFVLPFTVASVFNFDSFIVYFMMPGGRGIVTSELFRQIYFGAELVVGMLIPILFVAVDKHWFRWKDKTEWLHFLAAIPFAALLLIPAYVPQSLLGYTEIKVAALTLGNFVWILVTVIEIIVLYVIFRFKNRHQRLTLCWFLALGLFMHYNSIYIMGITLARLPFQLCNMAAYFFLVALFIKKKAFFNFIFLANVMGTIIAIIGPDTSGGAASFWNIHFLLEHMQVLVVPMMCMLLRIFPRVEKSALKHLTIGFVFYFLFCWISGTILNGYAAETGEWVNYFYLFNLKKGTDYFPFLSFVEKYTYVIFGRFTVYPVFQLLIFGGFLFGCVLLYLCIIKLYAVLDDHMRLREARIDLYEKTTGKKSNAPREFVE